MANSSSNFTYKPFPSLTPIKLSPKNTTFSGQEQFEEILDVCFTPKTEEAKIKPLVTSPGAPMKTNLTDLLQKGSISVCNFGEKSRRIDLMDFDMDVEEILSKSRGSKRTNTSGKIAEAPEIELQCLLSCCSE